MLSALVQSPHVHRGKVISFPCELTSEAVSEQFCRKGHIFQQGTTWTKKKCVNYCISMPRPRPPTAKTCAHSQFSGTALLAWTRRALDSCWRCRHSPTPAQAARITGKWSQLRITPLVTSDLNFRGTQDHLLWIYCTFRGTWPAVRAIFPNMSFTGIRGQDPRGSQADAPCILELGPAVSQDQNSKVRKRASSGSVSRSSLQK